MVLPKQMRLKGYKCFDYIYKTGTRYNGSSMLLRVAKSKPKLLKIKHSSAEESSLKCAIAISNKVSKRAVTRNKLRRLFHNHLSQRQAESTLKNKNWALLSLKPNSTSKNSLDLLQEFDNLLLKADLLS